MADLRDYRDSALAYLKKVKTSVKQYALNLTDLEVKVEEATNNEPWGPHGKLMHEICGCAWRDNESYRQIMGVIARRMEDKEHNWRHVYKSMLLLEHLIKNGPPKLIDELRANLDVLQKLKFFEYVDKKGKDHGLNVRNRAQILVNLLQDDDTIRMERAKARANATKYGGVSSDQMRFQGRNASFHDSFHASESRMGGYDTTPSFDKTNDPAAPYSKWASAQYSANKFEDTPEEGGERGHGAGRYTDDPMEATRTRIEKLKAQGQFHEEDNEDTLEEKKQKEALQHKDQTGNSQAFSNIKVTPAAPAAVAMSSTTPSMQQDEVNLLDLGASDPQPASASEEDPFSQLAAKVGQLDVDAEETVPEEEEEDLFKSIPPLQESNLDEGGDDGFGEFTDAGAGDAAPPTTSQPPASSTLVGRPIDLDQLLGASEASQVTGTQACYGVGTQSSADTSRTDQPGSNAIGIQKGSPLASLGLSDKGPSPVHFQRDHKLGSSPSKDPFAGIAGI
eukprot:CAMPEP_0183824288 /NCGR_PEP_ID=MMETSP0807_2-20130328/503_1 /TAXON_ID=88271 /ORGANISM="Picocystis salinarum, Strain CCMP1897" /LENGTH=505 /DNA_ID=CAMNT_0026069207 /DNA_START=262 /DNA_END=1780 /DNA_ORIENTATION=+